MTQELGVNASSSNINHKAKESILTNIELIIKQLDTEHIVTEARRRWLAKHYTNFILTAALKYIAGQKEHGDNIEDVDLLRELFGEFIDALHYHAALVDPLKRPIITNEP